LFAGTGKPNHVIRRKLLASEPKALHWYLNGKATRQNVIENLVKEKLGIQVDNLCQFLPQDRVANFSDMDPPLMLKETGAKYR
jgi:chromosome segregation ATPase